jgi:hypothetical protein
VEFAPFVDKILWFISSRHPTWPGDATADVTITPRRERVAFLAAVTEGTDFMSRDTYNFHFVQYQVKLNFYLGANRDETFHILQQIQTEFENFVLTYKYFEKTHIFLSALAVDQLR